MVLSKKQMIQRSQILESLYIHGSLSRAELSRLLGITPATMTEVTGHMIKDGVIKESGEENHYTGIGRKKILLEVSPEYSFYVGMELSEHKMVISLTDNLGECITSQQFSKEFCEGFPLTEDNVIQSLKNFLVCYQTYSIRAIGIAVPGHFEKKHQNILSNKRLWAEFDISKIISSFEIPVFVKNNVKCMALTQLYIDTKKKNFNFLFLNLKRGMFAAYVYDGDIYGDSNYLVGEVGHIIVNPDGEQCECGKAGCLQTYAGMNWILKKVRHAYEFGKKSYLNLLVDDGSEIDLSHVFLAYKMGDEIIHKIIEQAIDYLALQINNLTMILNVDAIYIHGKLFEEPLIADKLQAKLETAPKIIQQDHVIESCVLPYDSNRGAIGACTLAIRNHFILNSSNLKKSV